MKFEHYGDRVPTDPVIHAPNDTSKRGCDYSEWLDTNEVLANSTWILPTALTNVSDGFSDTLTNIYISGGTVNNTYKITNTITTDSTPPRIETRSMYIRCNTK